MTTNAETEALTLTTTAKAEADEFLAALRENLGDDVDMAREVCIEAKKKRDELDKQRKYLKAPSLETGRRIDELFMPPIRTLDDIVSLGKGVIIRNVERKRAEQEKAIAEATTADDVKAAVAEGRTAPPAGTNLRRIMRVRVIDWTKVPAHLLILDHKRAVEDAKAGEDISAWGEVFYDETVTVTG